MSWEGEPNERCHDPMGECKELARLREELAAMQSRAEAAEGDWQHAERKWNQAIDLLKALVIALRSGASTEEILETINMGAGITVPPDCGFHPAEETPK